MALGANGSRDMRSVPSAVGVLVHQSAPQGVVKAASWEAELLDSS
jgi:hypothetical protein